MSRFFRNFNFLRTGRMFCEYYKRESLCGVWMILIQSHRNGRCIHLYGTWNRHSSWQLVQRRKQVKYIIQLTLCIGLNSFVFIVIINNCIRHINLYLYLYDSRYGLCIFLNKAPLSSSKYRDKVEALPLLHCIKFESPIVTSSIVSPAPRLVTCHTDSTNNAL